jgi:hypothetical protein
MDSFQEVVVILMLGENVSFKYLQQLHDGQIWSSNLDAPPTRQWSRSAGVWWGTGYAFDPCKLDEKWELRWG